MMFDYSLFDSLLEPVFVIGVDHKVVYANETAQVLAGLSLRKMQKSRFDDLLSFSEKIDWLDHLETVKESTPYKELRFTNQAGEPGRVQITCRELTPAPEQNWIIFVRDVTLEERLQKKYRAELEQKEGYISELQKAQAELEKYSKNLEKMVEERTQEITRLNQQMKALLDSLHQGFLIFDQQGKCLEVSSKACATTLETTPAGKNIWDILRLPESKIDGFKKWLLTVFSEMLPFEDLAPLGPQFFPHSENKTIALEYFPLRNIQSQIEGVVVVATDITSLVEAKQQAELEKENAKLIIKLIKNKKEVSRFIRESLVMLTHLSEITRRPEDQWNREDLYRILHTIKGGSATFSIMKTAHLCHEAEQMMADNKNGFSSSQLDLFRSKCREIDASFQNYVNDTKEILGEKGLTEERIIEMPASQLMTVIQRLNLINKGQELSEKLLKTYLMEPASTFFEPYKELVQSLAIKEGKQVSPLIVNDHDIHVVPEIYSNLFACLVHAFRNGVDHGIETPEVRQQAGKPEAGKLEVTLELVKSSQDLLRIQVVDDGGGINPEKIRNKLASKGLDLKNETDEQIIQHIFDSEFSTRDIVTETSGRGVGMDAILSSAKNLGGKAWVQSTVGRGTTLIVEVPYIREIQQNSVSSKAA